MKKTVTSIAAFLLLSTASPLAADTPKTTMTIRVFDAVAVYAPPPWTNGKDVLNKTEIFQNQGDMATGIKGFIQEFIPKGESFDHWSELYAIMAETPKIASLSENRIGVRIDYNKACINNPKIVSLVSSKTRETVLAICPAYKDDPETGEMMMITMREYKDTLVKVYYHKRGQAFDINDPAGYPLNKADIESLLAQQDTFKLVAP